LALLLNGGGGLGRNYSIIGRASTPYAFSELGIYENT
jgi:hypothetical protein